MELQTITSAYIIQKIKDTEWKDRQYINILQQLERFIKHGANGIAGNQVYFNIRNSYRTEYLGLLKESSPERYEDELKSEKEQKELAAKKKIIDKQKKAIEEAEEKEAYKKWMNLGGKP